MFINGVFRVSSNIINAPNEIIKTIKYEKNLLLWVFLITLDLLSFSLIVDNSDFTFSFSSTGCSINWSLDLSLFNLSLTSFSLMAISSLICGVSGIGSCLL